MKKFAVKAVAKALVLKEKVKTALKDDSGASSVLSDHAGTIIAGIVIVAAVLVIILSWTKNTLVITIEKKILDIFNS
jgi:hypothetical protein